MKVTLLQLEAAIFKIKYDLLGYNSDKTNTHPIEIELIKADPGTGMMVDTLVLKGDKPESTSNDESHVSITIEIYPHEDKVNPNMERTVTSKLKLT
jgi:hypothetical protein